MEIWTYDVKINGDYYATADAAKNEPMEKLRTRLQTKDGFPKGITLSLQPERGLPVSYKPVFKVVNEDGWLDNGQRFATEEEACRSAQCRFRVWSMAKDYGAAPSRDPVNNRRVDDQDVPLGSKVEETPPEYVQASEDLTTCRVPHSKHDACHNCDDPHPLTHWLVAGHGYWGKGETMADAVKAAEWLRPGNKVIVFKVDAAAHVTGMGALMAHNSERIGDGLVGKGGVVTITPPLRPIRAIAANIIASAQAEDKQKRPFAKRFPHAWPYVEAMLSLDSINDNYLADSGKSVVLYALSNLRTWGGTNARRLKDELKTHLPKGSY